MSSKKSVIFWSVVGLGFSIACVIYLAKNVPKIEHIIQSFGIAGPLVSIVLYGLFSATPIPTDPLTVLNGALFGPLWGTIISWIGNNVAGIVEYFIGRSISHATDFHSYKEKLPFGLGKYPADSPWFLIFGRFIPQFGGKMVSILAGVYHVPITLYIWTSFVSNLAGSILLAFGGHGLRILTPH